MQDDQDAFDTLYRLGIRGTPVVVVGDRYAIGVDLTSVDELLGLSPGTGGRVLEVEEVVRRAGRILFAAGRFARQLPLEHGNDLLPGLKNTVSQIRRRDGSLYLPHVTAIGLVRHIIGHGEKLRFYVRPASRGKREENDFVDHIGEFSAFGEPPEATPMPSLIGVLDELGVDISTAESELKDLDFSRRVDFFFGTKTIHQFVQMMTVSLAHHTRQLMTFVSHLGIEPDAPLGERDFEGLQLPTNVFD